MQHRTIIGTGFTLVELSVVTAIIAMLASLSFIQFQQYRSRARDVEREQDIKELQKALALYVTEKRVFPISSGPITGADAFSLALLDAGAMPAIPRDPLSSGEYVYWYDSANGQSYTLTYTLETDSIPGKKKGAQSAGP